MATKMVTKSVQFHPEVWKLLQNTADDRDESTASLVRGIVEEYIQNSLIQDILDLRSEAIKKEYPNVDEKLHQQSQSDIRNSLLKKSIVELAKLINKSREKGDEYFTGKVDTEE